MSKATRRPAKNLKVVDMGEVNGVRLTYVNGNIFATPMGKPKPPKQSKSTPKGRK